MPNWCENTLTITGRSKKSIAAFKSRAFSSSKPAPGDKAEVTDFSLEQFIPTPPESLEKQGEMETMALFNAIDKGKKDFTDWYAWRLANWGCKWDVDASLDIDEPTRLMYVFMSPWGPPDKAIETISGMYPTLEFTLDYGEPGMNFAGTMVWKNGVLIENDERNYDYGEEIETA